MTASSVREQLRRRYAGQEWAFFEEVRSATGAVEARYADALAVNLWPSRGLEVHGFEIKASRADWKRELADPAKSCPVQRFCDRWWIVASGRNVVQQEELPPTWGLMVLSTQRLVIVKEAPKLEAESPSKEFTVSVLRAAAKQVTAEQQRVAQSLSSGEAAAEAYKRGVVDEKLRQIAEAAKTTAPLKRQLEELSQAVKLFEQQSGLRISPWTAGAVGDQVRALEQFRRGGSAKETLTQSKSLLRTALSTLEVLERVQQLT